MRELVADVDQLIDQRSLGATKHGLERVHPEAIHGVEEGGLIPAHFALTVGSQAGQLLQHLDLPMTLKRALQALFDKGDKRLGQQLHTLEHLLARTFGHLLVPLRDPTGSGDRHPCRGSPQPAE